MNEDQISQLLTNLLIGLVVLLFIIVTIFIILMIKSRKNNNENKKIKEEKKEVPKIKKEQNIQSVYDFMEFEDIIDNMIIKKKKSTYLMVLECQGINYDLMSGLEKNSTEVGFIEFLNALRFPIQIHIQTRSINLGKTLTRYKEKLDVIERKYNDSKMKYMHIDNSDEYTTKEKFTAKQEYVKAQNLYEYGMDILKDTEKMNLNKNVLKKHYYLIIAHSVEETEKGEYAEEEIREIAFSDLYTKVLSMVSLLAAINVNAKVLDTKQLIELMYFSYNRDTADLLEIDKMMDAGYMEMYSTAKNVMKKRALEIEKEIERLAKVKANQVAEEAYNNVIRNQEIVKKEKEMDFMIEQMASMILKDNKEIIGEEVYKESKKVLKENSKKTKSLKENKKEVK